MEIGQDAEEGLLLLAQGVHHGLALLHVRADVEMGQDAPLGHAGGPAGVLQQGRVVGHHALVGEPLAPLGQGLEREHGLAVKGNLGGVAVLAGLQRVQEVQREFQPLADGGDEEFFHGQGVAELFELGPEQIQGDAAAHPGVVELVDDLGFHVQGVGHDPHGPGPEHTPQGDDGLGQVGQHQRHPVALADTRRAQIGRHDLGLRLELGVSYRPVAENDGLALGPLVRGPVQELEQRNFLVIQGRRHIRIIGFEPGTVDLLHRKVPSRGVAW